MPRDRFGRAAASLRRGQSRHTSRSESPCASRRHRAARGPAGRTPGRPGWHSHPHPEDVVGAWIAVHQRQPLPWLPQAFGDLLGVVHWQPVAGQVVQRSGNVLQPAIGGRGMADDGKPSRRTGKRSAARLSTGWRRCRTNTTRKQPRARNDDQPCTLYRAVGRKIPIGQRPPPFRLPPPWQTAVSDRRRPQRGVADAVGWSPGSGAAVAQHVDQQRQGGRVLPAGIVEVVARKGGTPVLQRPLQPPGGQERSSLVLRHVGQT